MPALLLVVGFALIPIGVVAWSSLHDVTFGNIIQGDPQFIGLENYRSLTRDDAFYHAVRVTFLFGLFVVAGSYLVGLLAAALLDRTKRAKTLVFAFLLVPWAIPAVPTGLIFKWMLDGTYGITNYLLVTVGILDEPIQWFIDESLSFTSVTAATIWSLYPIAFIMLFAGLQTVPAELYEAARVDGANTWHEFKHVSLPALRPVTAVLILILILDSFRAVTLVFVMSGGGPARATENLALFSFTEAFSFDRLATASAGGVLTVALVSITSLIYVLIAKKRRLLDD